MGVPIDEGWSWMVCLGCHIVLFLVVGVMRCIGIIFVELQETFRCSSTETSMLLAILSITVALFSPAANALAAVFSNRVVIIVGSMFTAFGFIIVCFADNITTVIIFMGFFVGLGISFQYSTSVVMIGQFFDKRRSLANGIAMAGGSIGQLVLPPLITHLVERYSFRGAVLIIAGILLNASVGAMLFTPMSFYKKKVDKKRPSSIYIKNDLKSKTDESAGSSLMKSQEDLKPSKSMTSVFTDVYSVDFNSPIYASTGSLYFSPNRDTPAEVVHAKNKEMSDTIPEPYNTGLKPSLCDLLHATFCCCITCKKHNGPVMWDWRLFTNALFIIYIIGTSTGNAGYVDIFMFIPPYFKDIGLMKRETAMLLAVGGGSDLFGRLLGGWFADLGFIKRHNIMAVCMGFTGVVIFTMLFFPSFASSMVLIIVLGFTGGFYMSLFSLVIIDFLGLQIMPLAFGMSVLILCLVNTFMPALLGMLCDLTQSYFTALVACAILMIICGIAFACEPIARWHVNRQRRLAGEDCFIDGPKLRVGSSQRSQANA